MCNKILALARVTLVNSVFASHYVINGAVIQREEKGERRTFRRSGIGNLTMDRR